MYLQQISLIKLKYISDCQVAYKEDEREIEWVREFLRSNQEQYLGLHIKKRWIVGGIVLASLTSDIPS